MVSTNSIVYLLHKPIKATIVREIILSSWCLWILLFHTESSQESPKCHCCYRIELQCLEGKDNALYQAYCMSAHPALIGSWHRKHHLTHPVHCWGLQHVCSLQSGKVEQKTKGGVGSLLAHPHNLERQVWLRKGTVSLTWGLMCCIITTTLHSKIWIIGIQFTEANSSAN